MLCSSFVKPRVVALLYIAPSREAQCERLCRWFTAMGCREGGGSWFQSIQISIYGVHLPADCLRIRHYDAER